MTQGHIYMVEPKGGLRRMIPSAPENEERMQHLVARYPELITDGDGDLLLIRREQPVADGDAGSGRWSLDHLFVTQEAVPVLVEMKRAVDTRLRREVVGQLLDYAANATAYWQAGRIADSFAETAAGDGVDPETTLTQFIGERDPADFWDQVDANFKAGRVKLVFVADTIPRELARIVEFLNDQMRADVRAVELRWFSGEGGVTALSPRVIGETERAAAEKQAATVLPPISLDGWVEQHMVGGEDATGARAYIAIVQGLGGEPAIPPSQASIAAKFKGANGKTFNALYLYKQASSVSLPFGWLLSRLPDEDVRRDLLGTLQEIVGRTSSQNLQGYPEFKVEKLADPTIASQFDLWLQSALEKMR